MSILRTFPPPADPNRPDTWPPRSSLETDDGEPMESSRHRANMALLIDVVAWRLRHRDDWFVGGNLGVYFSPDQVRNRDFRAPDFLFFEGVSPGERTAWVVWEEGFRYPDVIVELISDTTRDIDLGLKRDLYEQVFHTREYYCYDPFSTDLIGWRLDSSGRYQPIAPNAHGQLPSQVLGMTFGVWRGGYADVSGPAPWLRFFEPSGELVPLPAEFQQRRNEDLEQRLLRQLQRAEHLELKLAQQNQLAEERLQHIRQLQQELDRQIQRNQELEHRLAEQIQRNQELEHRLAEQNQRNQELEHQLAEQRLEIHQERLRSDLLERRVTDQEEVLRQLQIQVQRLMKRNPEDQNEKD